MTSHGSLTGKSHVTFWALVRLDPIVNVHMVLEIVGVVETLATDGADVIFKLILSVLALNVPAQLVLVLADVTTLFTHPRVVTFHVLSDQVRMLDFEGTSRVLAGDGVGTMSGFHMVIEFGDSKEGLATILTDNCLLVGRLLAGNPFACPLVELPLTFCAKELHAESALDLSNPLVLLLKVLQVLVPATGREVQANPADGVVVLSRFFDVIGQLGFLDEGCAATGADKGLGMSKLDMVFISLHVTKPEGLRALGARNLVFRMLGTNVIFQLASIVEGHIAFAEKAEKSVVLRFGSMPLLVLSEEFLEFEAADALLALVLVTLVSQVWILGEMEERLFESHSLNVIPCGTPVTNFLSFAPVFVILVLSLPPSFGVKPPGWQLSRPFPFAQRPPGHPDMILICFDIFIGSRLWLTCPRHNFVLCGF